MDQQIESFLSSLAEERRLSANTVSAYRNDLRQFHLYLASNARTGGDGVDGADRAVPLAAVGREQVAAFFLHLREQGYSPATIARKMAAVKSLFQFCYRRGLIATNPAASIGSPEVRKPVPRAISPREIALLLEQASTRAGPEGLRDAAMLHVLCATGMRVTELVSLDLGDLDLAAGRVRCTGRNGRRRELPIDARAVEALDRYLTEGRPQLLRGVPDDGAAFLNHRGRRLTRQGFWLIMKALARASGLAREITPHMLRHSFAAQRLRDGLELRHLRDLLGHANISTTQIYTQVRLETETPVANGVSPPVLSTKS